MMEDETNTGTTTEANEPIEVDDDVSHETSENKEQGRFQSRWASLYTWLTYYYTYTIAGLSIRGNTRYFYPLKMVIGTS
jgi:hypothetical protein